jgi:hypothetical protein
MQIAELGPPIFVTTDHVIVESALPDAIPAEPARPNHSGEGAVEATHHVAYRERAGKRQENVVVIRHHDVAVEDHVTAVARLDPERDKRLGEIGVGQEPTSPVETADESVGVVSKIDARESAMAHSEKSFLWAGDTLLPYGRAPTCRTCVEA